MNSHSSDVLILGAGAAGLAAADELRHSGLKITILEAQDRIGGRILTEGEMIDGIPCELGAEFIHGLAPQTLRLMHELQISYSEMPDQHLVFTYGKIRNDLHYERDLEKIFARMKKHRRKDRSFLEFLQTQHFVTPRQKRARDWVIAYIEGFDAARVDWISEKSLVNANQISEKIQGNRIFRPTGGYRKLIELLAQRATLNLGLTLRLQCEAKQIHWTQGRVTIKTQSGQIFTAHKLIFTLPVSVWETIPFSPAIPYKSTALSLIEMGAVVKIVLRFKEKFWKNEDLSFVHGKDLDFPTWWTTLPYHSPILTGWAGGPAADRLTSLSEQDRIQLALQSLSALFQVRIAQIQSLLAESAHLDWQSNPFSQGAYTYIKRGGSAAPRLLAKSVDETLYFAGEATDSEGLGGTVESAFNSGIRAAQELAQVKQSSKLKVA